MSDKIDMKKPTFGIYIPSYKRAKTCNAHVFLEYGTYIVRQSEYNEYAEQLSEFSDHIKVKGVPDHEICGLTEVNQWLIDNAEEDVIAILDDDIHHFYYRTLDTISIDDAETVTSELERVGQIMYDLGIGFGATDATIRPWNYDCEFAFKGCAGAVRWVNRTTFKAKCNKELEYNYDLDLVLQELLYNRIIIKPKYFCSKGLTDTNEGGASGKMRGDQVASIKLMEQKWGKYFSYNLKTNVPHINVKR